LKPRPFKTRQNREFFHNLFTTWKGTHNSRRWVLFCNREPGAASWRI